MSERVEQAGGTRGSDLRSASVPRSRARFLVMTFPVLTFSVAANPISALPERSSREQHLQADGRSSHLDDSCGHGCLNITGRRTMVRMYPPDAPSPVLRTGAKAPVIGSIRTVTIVFADLVRSTDTRSRLGDPAADWHWLTIEHALVGAIAGADGRVVKSIGDGIVAAFESASTALDASMAAMRSVEHEQLRVGIATGDVAVVQHDVLGTPVVVAARLCRAARPNQILATGLVLAAAGTRTDARSDWRGQLDLKGLPSPIDATSIGWQVTTTTGPALDPDPTLNHVSGSTGRSATRSSARPVSRTPTPDQPSANLEEPNMSTTEQRVPAANMDAPGARGPVGNLTASGVGR